MVVLGIDAATKSGWAAVRRETGRETVLGTGIADGTDAHSIEALVDQWSSADLVAIEDPYLDKNAHTLKVLARIQGRWAQEFERRLVPVRFVPATSWQMGLMAGLVGRGSKRAQLKAAAQLWAARVFKLKLGPDEADALGLAVYGARVLCPHR